MSIKSFLPVFLFFGFFVSTGCVKRVVTEPAPEFSFEDARVERSNPRYVASLNLVEDALKEMKLQRLGRAASQLSQAIEIDPSNPYAYFYLAEVRKRSKRYQESIELYRRAEDRFAANSQWSAECFAEIGDVYRLQNQNLEAEEAYRDALELNPRNHRAIEGLAGLPANP